MLREKVVKSFNFLSRAQVSKPPTPTNSSYPFQQVWQFKQHLCAWPPPGPHCPPILSSSTHWKAESALRGGCLPLLLLLLLFTSPQPYHHSLPHSWPSLPFITSLSNKLGPLHPLFFLHLLSVRKKVQDTSHCAPSITKDPPALPEILSLINVLAGSLF